jgi:hypothetical protein
LTKLKKMSKLQLKERYEITIDFSKHN